MPKPTSRQVVFFVREAFPSIATETGLTEGILDRHQSLTVVSRIEAGGVIFGDGIESDRIEFLWGARATVKVASAHLRLLVA